MKVTDSSPWWGLQHYNIYSVIPTAWRIVPPVEAMKLALLWAACVLVHDSPGLFVDPFAMAVFPIGQASFLASPHSLKPLLTAQRSGSSQGR